MRIHHLLLVSVLFPSTNAAAQSQPSPPLQVYAGYSWLSNSFNGTRGARQALNGWNGGAAFRDWHHLRFKLDYSMFRGVNKTDPQHAFLIMGGGQYETTFHREGLFAEALLGEAGVNGNWFSTDTAGYKNGNTGSLRRWLSSWAEVSTPPSALICHPRRGRRPAHQFRPHRAASRRAAVSSRRHSQLLPSPLHRHRLDPAPQIPNPTIGLRPRLALLSRAISSSRA